MRARASERDRRERLLRAAEREFARVGVAGARTRDIAAAAGVDQKLIGYHFGGKQGLYHAVLRQAAETLAAELAPLAELAASDPEIALREVVQLVARTTEQHEDLVRVVVRELLDGRPGELARTLEAVLPPFSAALEILDGFIERGTVRPVSPSLIGIAVAALAGVSAAIPGVPRLLPAATTEERAEMVADLLAHGLLAPVRPGPPPPKEHE